MSSALGLAILALVGVVFGAVITGLASLGTTWLANRQAQDDRRRTAYQLFIIAMDRLYTLWTDSPVTDDAVAVAYMCAQTGKLANAIQEAYPPVLLSGDESARDAADKARVAAWAMHDYFCPPPGKLPGREAARMSELFDIFSAFRSDFRKAVEPRRHRDWHPKLTRG